MKSGMIEAAFFSGTVHYCFEILILSFVKGLVSLVKHVIINNQSIQRLMFLFDTKKHLYLNKKNEESLISFYF
jgi:hypothetical protein